MQRLAKQWFVGFGVYLEWEDGYVLHGTARPATGGARLPSLGVEDYTYYTMRRGAPAWHMGPRSLIPTIRAPTPAQLDALREAVRHHLACLDAHGDPLPDPATLYVDAHGSLVLVRCPWAFALLANRDPAPYATCTTGTQCACVQEEPPAKGPLRVADAEVTARYWDGAAAAAADALA